MQARRYGPFPFSIISRRAPYKLPAGARVAVWVNPNVEFFGLDDVMPGVVNERVAREHARVPNVRNWALRDYGNRVGLWRIMQALDNHGMRASAALNSEVFDQHPEIIEEMLKRDWELMGHGKTNALRMNEMPPEAERETIFQIIETFKRASGKGPQGWLGPGLAETWNTLEFLHEAGVRYVCDWINDDQPYAFDLGTPPMLSVPYSVQTNDVPAYFDMKMPVPEFERALKDQFDVLWREGETSGRVMAIAVHPFVTGQPHRIGALERALDHICQRPGVWLTTAAEIAQHYRDTMLKPSEHK
jgi:peptidoglycan/xylan/chitin deacetylase (PgdA/CDA1 family)